MLTKNVATSKKRVFGRSDYKHELEETRDKEKVHSHYIPMFLGMGLAVICFLLLFISTGVASATDYYVATWGSDSDPGTEAQPWRTIQKAANTLIAGDTVYIKAGIYNERVISKNSGSPGNYITYTAYPGDTVTIDGTGISFSWAGLFHIMGKSYIKVSGLRIINSAYFGIEIGDSAEHTADHIIVENNYIHNCQSSGVHAMRVHDGVSDVIIDGNEISETNKGTGQEGISMEYVDKFEVKNNHVHHCYKEGIDAKQGCSNIKIYKNHVHDFYTKYNIGIYVDAFERYEHDIEVYQNIVHDAGIAIALATEQGGELNNIGIHNNIGYNCNYGFVLTPYGIPGWKRNVKVINNGFYNNNYYGIRIQDTLIENLIVRNNICSKNQYAQIHKQYLGEFIIDHNLIDGPTDIYGDNAVIGDPKFVNPVAGDFHLQPDSPAIDAGSSVDAPSVDFDGNSRPQGAGYDIGAYEFVVAGATGTISGTLTSTTGAPIQGATVTANGYSDPDGTDANGYYLIPGVPVGNYIVTVSKTGYQSQSQENVEVLEDQTTTVDFQLTEKSDLVGLWHFDEGSGTVALDSSKYGNDGTINGATWTSGKLGSALDFDGIDDYVDCGNDTSLNNMFQTKGTAMLWLKPDFPAGTGTHYLFNKEGTNYIALYKHKNEPYGMQFETYYEGEYHMVYNYSSPNWDDVRGIWIHIAAVWDWDDEAGNKEMKLYLNGDLLSDTITDTSAISPSSTGDFFIGKGTGWLAGTIDEVKIYNKALSAEEIKADYEAGSEEKNPPASISDLQNNTGTTWINWTWTNPPDDDFNHTMVYLDGVLQTNTSDNYYNAMGLIANTSYEIGIHTVDTNGNVNNTWVNQTTTTAASPDTSPPLLTNPTATPATILNDNSRPRAPGTNISQLNVTVTDDTEVDTVTIDLSPIGGSAEALMSKIPGTDIWSVTVTATAGVNLTHNLIVTATDIYGNSNTSVSIQLTVLRRGDVFRDNVVDRKDAEYIARYLAGSEPEVPNLVLVGDVVGKNGSIGDGVVDMKDAAYIARYEAGFEDVP